MSCSCFLCTSEATTSMSCLCRKPSTANAHAVFVKFLSKITFILRIIADNSNNLHKRHIGNSSNIAMIVIDNSNNTVRRNGLPEREGMKRHDLK